MIFAGPPKSIWLFRNTLAQRGVLFRRHPNNIFFRSPHTLFHTTVIDNGQHFFAGIIGEERGTERRIHLPNIANDQCKKKREREEEEKSLLNPLRPRVCECKNRLKYNTQNISPLLLPGHLSRRRRRGGFL